MGNAMEKGESEIFVAEPRHSSEIGGNSKNALLHDTLKLPSLTGLSSIEDAVSLTDSTSTADYESACENDCASNRFSSSTDVSDDVPVDHGGISYASEHKVYGLVKPISVSLETLLDVENLEPHEMVADDELTDENDNSVEFLKVNFKNGPLVTRGATVTTDELALATNQLVIDYQSADSVRLTTDATEANADGIFRLSESQDYISKDTRHSNDQQSDASSSNCPEREECTSGSFGNSYIESQLNGLNFKGLRLVNNDASKGTNDLQTDLMSTTGQMLDTDMSLAEKAYCDRIETHLSDSVLIKANIDSVSLTEANVDKIQNETESPFVPVKLCDSDNKFQEVTDFSNSSIGNKLQIENEKLGGIIDNVVTQEFASVELGIQKTRDCDIKNIKESQIKSELSSGSKHLGDSVCGFIESSESKSISEIPVNHVDNNTRIDDAIQSPVQNILYDRSVQSCNFNTSTEPKSNSSGINIPAHDNSQLLIKRKNIANNSSKTMTPKHKILAKSPITHHDSLILNINHVFIKHEVKPSTDKNINRNRSADLSEVPKINLKNVGLIEFPVNQHSDVFNGQLGFEPKPVTVRLSDLIKSDKLNFKFCQDDLKYILRAENFNTWRTALNMDDSRFGLVCEISLSSEIASCNFQVDGLKLNAMNCKENISEAGPATAAELDGFSNAQFLNSTSEIDFISKMGGTGVVAENLRKQSLYVKFDPLVGEDINDSTFNGDETVTLNDSRNNSFTKETKLNSSSEQKESGDVTIVENDGGNVGQLISVTPVKSPRKHTPKSSPRYAETDPDEVSKLQSLLLKQMKKEELFKEEIEMLKRENEQTVAKLQSAENDINQLRTQLECVQDDDKKLRTELKEMMKSKQQLSLVMEEYEKTISQMVSRRDEEKKEYELALKKAEMDRDSTIQHLNNLEHAFNDIHQKYERGKIVNEALKKNEEALQKSLKDYEVTVNTVDNKYELLKSHATSQLEKANQELELITQSMEKEQAKLKAMLRKSEIQINSLQNALDRKTKENQELTSICDELIVKLSAHSNA